MKAKIIPTLLSDKGKLVKGEGFEHEKTLGSALETAKAYAVRQVDELIFLDITATEEGREPNYKTVETLSERCHPVLTVGGGIKTEDHVENLLNAGAKKVCIGAASNDLAFIKRLSEKFGSKRITVSYDVIDGSRNIDLYNLVSFEKYGAGEVLLQSMERDGTMQGYDLDLIKQATDVLNIPVIASGGCGGYEDMSDAIESGASSVAVGALFQFTKCTPRGARRYLEDRI